MTPSRAVRAVADAAMAKLAAGEHALEASEWDALEACGYERTGVRSVEAVLADGERSDGTVAGRVTGGGARRAS